VHIYKDQGLTSTDRQDYGCWMVWTPT